MLPTAQPASDKRTMSATSALSLLLIFMLLITAEGVRLDKESRASFQFQKATQIVTADRRSLAQETSSAAGGAAPREGTKPSTAGDGGKMTAKAMTKESSSSGSTPPAAMDHQKLKTEKYPDLVDLAGMDYSPAIRKPPIHN